MQNCYLFCVICHALFEIHLIKGFLLDIVWIKMDPPVSPMRERRRGGSSEFLSRGFAIPALAS